MLNLASCNTFAKVITFIFTDYMCLGFTYWCTWKSEVSILQTKFTTVIIKDSIQGLKAAKHTYI